MLDDLIVASDGQLVKWLGDFCEGCIVDSFPDESNRCTCVGIDEWEEELMNEELVIGWWDLW